MTINGDQRRPFRVLSFDGGTSASFNLRMLRYVADSLEKKGLPGLLASTDLFVGNSAGALVAMYLSYQLGATSDDDSISESAIFDGAISFFDQLVVAANGSLDAIVNLLWGKQAAIDSQKLLDLFNDTFGDTPYSELPTPVMATSFMMQEPARPEIKCSAALLGSEGNMTIVDAGMQSSAFPLFYPIYQSHIDGAFVSNNPSMMAIGQVLELARSGQSSYFQDVRLEDIVLFSTGSDSPSFAAGTFPTEDESWGWRQWLLPHIRDQFTEDIEQNARTIRDHLEQELQNGEFNFETMLVVSALLYGNSQGVRKQCAQFLSPGSFLRLAFPGYKSIGELMLVLLAGLGPLLAPLSIAYALEWRLGALPTGPYNPSLDDVVNWLQAAWLPAQ